MFAKSSSSSSSPLSICSVLLLSLLSLSTHVHASLLSPLDHHLAAKSARTTHCSAGQWNNQGSCTTCQSGHSCDGTNQYMCQQGTYAPSGASSCTTCPAGYYCNGQGLSAPTKCPPGQYAPHTGYGQSCDPCPAGFWNNAQGSTTCCPCCAGSFNSQTSQTHCQACANGQTSDAGASSCHSGSGPTPPSWCTNGVQSGGTDVCPASASTRKRSGPRKKTVCPLETQRDCPILSGRGGFECVDILTDLESCGGCLGEGGVDCSALDGVDDVACAAGKCVVRACGKGWEVAPGGEACVPLGRPAMSVQMPVGRR